MGKSLKKQRKQHLDWAHRSDAVVSERPLTIANRHVLAINANYQPLMAITLEDAIGKIFKEGATIVVPPNDECKSWQEFTWMDWSALMPRDDEERLQASERAFKIPEIIKYVDYRDLPDRSVKLSRRAIYRRDDFQCQYCGVRPKDISELSIDHVVPKSKGGKMKWDNVLIACVECNLKKAARTPEEANMKPLKKPVAPPYDVLRGKVIRVDSWQSFLGEAFWNVPLID